MIKYTLRAQVAVGLFALLRLLIIYKNACDNLDCAGNIRVVQLAYKLYS